MKAAQRFFGHVVVALTVTWVSAAFACPVCFAAKNEANRKAFLATTVFMSALPLLMVGAGAWWVARRIRENELAVLDSPTRSDPVDDSSSAHGRCAGEVTEP